MPRRITIAGGAHVMMVYNKHLNEELTYSGYRRDGSISAEKRIANTIGSDGSN
jgi:hypothetical protein